MAIDYPLASPVAFGVAHLTWGGMTSSERAKAPWTFQDLVQIFDGEMWAGELTIVPQEEADGRRLAAWLTSLRGKRGTFLLGDPAATAPLGAAKDTPGLPVVDGGGQSGTTLAVRGLPPDLQGYLLAGDYLSIGEGAAARLYMVMQDVDGESDGGADVEIWPPLRSSPADGEPVTLVNPQGVFALTTPLNQWQVSPPMIYDGVTLSVNEVIA